MYCVHCGKKIEDYASFCPLCGEKVTPLANYKENIVKADDLEPDELTFEPEVTTADDIFFRGLTDASEEQNPTDALLLEALDRNLFGTVELGDETSAETTKKIDKFYTLYRKNEEFQRLLDEEYSRFKAEHISVPEEEIAAEIRPVEDAATYRLNMPEELEGIAKRVETDNITITDDQEAKQSEADKNDSETRSDNACFQFENGDSDDQKKASWKKTLLFILIIIGVLVFKGIIPTDFANNLINKFSNSEQTEEAAYQEEMTEPCSMRDFFNNEEDILAYGTSIEDGVLSKDQEVRSAYIFRDGQVKQFSLDGITVGDIANMTDDEIIKKLPVWHKESETAKEGWKWGEVEYKYTEPEFRPFVLNIVTDPSGNNTLVEELRADSYDWILQEKMVQISMYNDPGCATYITPIYNTNFLVIPTDETEGGCTIIKTDKDIILYTDSPGVYDDVTIDAFD